MTEVQKELYKAKMEMLGRDISLTRIYAKSKCQLCSGKGYLDIELGVRKQNASGKVFHQLERGKDNLANKYICSCVEKNVKKEVLRTE